MTDFLFGNVLSSQRSPKGTITLNIGDATSGEGTYAEDVGLWLPAGMVAVPSNPSADNSTEVLAFRDGNEDFAFAFRDLRARDIYGSLDPGETIVFALGPDGAGQGRIFLKDDGSKSTISILTKKDDSDSGNAIMFNLSSDESVSIVNSDKSFIDMKNDGSVCITGANGQAYIEITADGKLNLNAKEINILGGKVALGVGAALAVVGATTQGFPLVSGAPGAPVAPGATASTCITMAL